MLCAPHLAPENDMSFERAQALSRLRGLKHNLGNHIFWGDIAFKVRAATYTVGNGSSANLQRQLDIRGSGRGSLSGETCRQC